MIHSAQVAVADVAVSLLPEGGERDARRGSGWAVKNLGPDVVYVGAAGVTSSTGWPLAVGEPVGVDLEGPDDVPFGVCASGESASVALLRAGA